VGDASGLVASGPLAGRIAELANNYVALAKDRDGQLPVTDYDSDWPSVCVSDVLDADRCAWRPVRMNAPLAFERLAHALDVPIHDSLVTYFSVQWAASIPVMFEDNELDLLQLWNDQDFENLLANLIGHALEKKRVSQPLTLFFALVDDDRLLTVDNESGVVMLETLGQRTPLEVAPSLLAFAQSLEARWPNLPAD